MLYKVMIGAVDGETHYTCGGRAGTVLLFLMRHDHEGSSVSLEMWRGMWAGKPLKTFDGDPGEIYAELCKAAALVLEG